MNVELNRWRCNTCDISEDSLDVIRHEKSLSLTQARAWAKDELGMDTVIGKPKKGGGNVSSRSLWND